MAGEPAFDRAHAFCAVMSSSYPWERLYWLVSPTLHRRTHFSISHQYSCSFLLSFIFANWRGRRTKPSLLFAFLQCLVHWNIHCDPWHQFGSSFRSPVNLGSVLRFHFCEIGYVGLSSLEKRTHKTYFFFSIERYLFQKEREVSWLVDWFTARNWLTWLWRLSSPKSCSWHTGDSGEPMV